MDLFNIFGKLKDVQSKIKEAQGSLGEIIVEAEAGAGLVKATVNGKRQVIKVEIDPSLIKPEDKDMLQDLIVAAINKGLEEADEKAKETLQKATEGMIPNIPGFDFSFGK
ncbi:MAG: YbaB/EbfC family nucleoid-associated protein [Cyclobacteriaceae bacterium]